ncbi:MAG: hypothetical protein ACJ8LG_22280 [Massilia sp.]
MLTVKVPESTTVDRTTIAREQSALFPARLAMARWASGGDLPHLGGNARLSLRAAWFAQAERNFQCWLDRGGFTQYDEAPAGREPPAPDGKEHSADYCL